jgi:hypothetical protein
MPRRGGRREVLVEGAEQAMEAFKMEVAEDLGIDATDTRKLTTVQAGSIGGEMVRQITAAGEWAIKQRYDNHEKDLMPPDVLPKLDDVKPISNAGNKIHDMGETTDKKTPLQ